MNTIDKMPGTIIATRVFVLGFLVTHVGVLTDQIGVDGERTVVSLSRRWRRAAHETLTSFRGGQPWWVVGYPGRLAPVAVVARAFADVRAQRPWTIFSNCEHAVRRWHGVVETSPQLQQALSTAGGLSALLLFLSRLR